jgi:hypothetical protein
MELVKQEVVFESLAVALIVVSSQACFFIHSITFMMVRDDVKIEGDGVKSSGDDVAVPVGL